MIGRRSLSGAWLTTGVLRELAAWGMAHPIVDGCQSWQHQEQELPLQTAIYSNL